MTDKELHETDTGDNWERKAQQKMIGIGCGLSTLGLAAVLGASFLWENTPDITKSEVVAGVPVQLEGISSEETCKFVGSICSGREVRYYADVEQCRGDSRQAINREIGRKGKDCILKRGVWVSKGTVTLPVGSIVVFRGSPGARISRLEPNDTILLPRR